MRRQSGTVALHVYLDDGTSDHHGDGRCADCGLPKANRSHRLPDVSDEQRAAEARRVGESDA